MAEKIIRKPELRKEYAEKPNEPPKALPPYKRDYSQIAVVVIGAIVLVGLLVAFQQSAKEPGQPTATPTKIITPTPTPAPKITPSPEPSLVPIPTIKKKEASVCGKVSSSITLQNDVYKDDTCFTVEKEGVTIDCAGFTILGTVTFNSTGVYSAFPGTVVKNCVITSFGVGVRFSKTEGSSVESSTFSNNLGGVVAENSGNIKVLESKFFNHSDVAILLTLTENSEVRGNFIDGNKKFGLHLFSADDNEIADNTIYRSGFGFQIAKSDRNTITGNNVSYNFAGFKVLEGSTENIFEKNFVSNTRGIGVHVLDSPGNTFRSNTIINNEYGANLRDSGSFLEGNFVCDNSIEDFECNTFQNATSNTCFLRATTCQFDCAFKCPSKQ